MPRRTALLSIVLIVWVLLSPVRVLAQSQNLTLLGHLDLYTEYSDIWGYRASDGTELAIIGTTNGTSFVDATDPAAPSEVAFISGPSSIWRDIKTYGEYAYIVNETSGGLQIVDLSNPQSPSLVTNDATFFNTSHNLFVDTTAARLYAVGANPSPLTTVLDLTDPENPALVLNFTDFYIHDIFVQDGLAWAADLYEASLATIDVSSLPAYTVLDKYVTPGAFCHNTWATADGHYCLTTDEVTGGHIAVYDTQNPAMIAPVSEWTHPTDPNSIVHNVTVLDDLAYVSWYKTGLQILDISDPAFPQRVGFYDTFPDTGAGYDGAWGVYPYQPSGTVYISDISTGLYLFSFDPDYGNVVGTVTDQVSALPVEGIRVRVASEYKEVFTLSSGAYKLSMVPGSYDVVYEGFAHESDTVTVSVTRSATTVQNVSLVPRPAGSANGFVGELGAYSPLADALITLDGTPLSDATGADGRFEFPSIPVGAYTMKIDLFGYAPWEGPVSIAEGEATEVNATLTPAVLVDDLEMESGWTVGAPGDNATSGIWELADPEGTGGGVVQPEDDHTPAPGVLCFITGASGGGIGDNDVDGGTTTLLSPIVDLAGIVNPVFSYYRWYVNDAGNNPGTDNFVVDVSDNGGASWTNLESTNVSNAAWQKIEYPLTGVISLTNQVRFRFRASDLGGGSVVEAGVDDAQLFGTNTTVSVPDDGHTPRFRLLPAAPNPFHSATQIRYQLDRRAHVLVDVFDAQGRRVAVLVDEVQPSGPHAVTWTGREQSGGKAPSGVYFVRFVAPGRSDGQKIVLFR